MTGDSNATTTGCQCPECQGIRRQGSNPTPPDHTIVRRVDSLLVRRRSTLDDVTGGR